MLTYMKLKNPTIFQATWNLWSVLIYTLCIFLIFIIANRLTDRKKFELIRHTLLQAGVAKIIF